MAFESGDVSEDWSSAVILSLYKGTEERTDLLLLIRRNPNRQHSKA